MVLRTALVENTEMKLVGLWTGVFKHKHLLTKPGAEVQAGKRPHLTWGQSVTGLSCGFLFSVTSTLPLLNVGRPRWGTMGTCSSPR